MSKLPLVCLYTPFSSQTDCGAIPRQPLALLRNRARRALDMALWVGARHWQFHYSTYEDRTNTNRGDSAIRIASRALIEQAFDGHVRIMELGWEDFGPEVVERLNAEVALFVVGGGGYYFCDQAGRINRRVVRDAQLLPSLRCPVVSLCPGINRLLREGEENRVHLDGDSLLVLERFLGQLSLSSVRDHVTRRALASAGGAEALADPALFLDPVGRPRRDDDGAVWVGLNLAFHGTFSADYLRDMIAMTAQVAKRLASQRRCRFLYFVHSDSERLIPRLLALAGVVTQVVDASPAEMVAWYGLLDVHMAEMLHSVILSSNAGVPSVSLAYDVKHEGFAEMMALQPWCLTIHEANPDRVAGMLMDLIARREEVSRHMLERKALLRAQMDDYLRRMAGLVSARLPAAQGTE